jgi:hypothetical protein
MYALRTNIIFISITKESFINYIILINTQQTQQTHINILKSLTCLKRS